MSNRISVCMAFYNDFDFIDDAVSLIEGMVDEIIVVDGPYGYAIESLNFMGEYYDEDNPPAELETLRNHPKVKYFYDVWENEITKRAFGYAACDGDIILVLDADELMDLNLASIAQFIESQYAAARLDILALVRGDVVMGPPHQVVRLFKRSMISPLAHIDYLGCVGVDMKAPNMTVVFGSPVGTCYHPSLMRSLKGHVVKGAFYGSLHQNVHGTRHPFLEATGCESFDQILASAPSDVLREVSVRSGLSSMNAPDSWVLSRKSSFNERLDPVVESHEPMMSSRSLDPDSPTPLLTGIASIRYLPELKPDLDYEITLSVTNAQITGVQIHELHFGVPNSENQIQYGLLVPGDSGELGSFERQEPHLERYQITTTNPPQGTFARLLSITACAETGMLGSLESVTIRHLGQ